MCTLTWYGECNFYKKKESWVWYWCSDATLQKGKKNKLLTADDEMWQMLQCKGLELVGSQQHGVSGFYSTHWLYLYYLSIAVQYIMVAWCCIDFSQTQYQVESSSFLRSLIIVMMLKGFTLPEINEWKWHHSTLFFLKTKEKVMIMIILLPIYLL